MSPTFPIVQLCLHLVGEEMCNGTQFKVFLQFFLVRAKVSKLSSPVMWFKLLLFTIFWKPTQIRTIVNETCNDVDKCSFFNENKLWLIHCCVHAGLLSIKDCVMNPSAAWKGFVLSAITANWSFVPALKVPSWPLWIVEVRRIHQLLGHYQEF